MFLGLPTEFTTWAISSSKAQKNPIKVLEECFQYYQIGSPGGIDVLPFLMFIEGIEMKIVFSDDIFKAGVSKHHY